MSGCKFIALLRKRADISHERFVDYYENHHVPLILSLFPTIIAYRRNYAEFSEAIVYPAASPFDFDVITEIHFADRAGYDDMLARFARPEVSEAVRADEGHFLDQSFTRMFLVDEHASEVSEASTV